MILIMIYDFIILISFPRCNRLCLWAKQCEKYINVDSRDMFDLGVTLCT